MVDTDAEAQEGSGAPRAIRLTFRYEGDSVELLSLRRVRKALPVVDADASPQDRIGTWTEVRDADEQTLDQRAVPEPVRGDAEVFPEGLGEPITRIPLDRPAGVFTVLVPDLRAADHLSLMRRTAAGREARIDSNEIVRVSLKAEPDPPEKGGS